MISKTYASKILNSLIGVKAAKTTNGTDNTLGFTENVYLGLCAEEPNKDTGALTNNNEPIDTTDVKYGYSRKQVSGSNDTATSQYFATASGGTISNSSEIQFNTAKNDYPQKINYWFLAPASTGAAFLWGEIKDVMSSELTASNFSQVKDASSMLPEGDDRDVYSTTITLDDTLSFKTTEKYIIAWDGKDYKNLIPSVQGNTTVLGNSLFTGGADNEVPFVIAYNNEEVNTGEGIVNKGKLTVYSFDPNQHTIDIYALGINVKKNTVPTFFEKQLKASIDV